MKKLLIWLFFLNLLFTLILQYFSYAGDSSPELRKDILLHFTEEDIRSGVEYFRSGFGLSVSMIVIQSLLIFIFIFTPFSVNLEDFFMKKTKNRFFLGSWLYFLSVIFFLNMVRLPADYYFGFILEEKFGFSNMTALDWFIREMKEFSLSIAIVPLMGICALWIIKKFPKYWIVFIPIAVLVFGMFMMVVYPHTILPWFYKTTHIESGTLKKQINELTEKMQIPVKDVYVIEESRYSNHTNAMFTGFGSERKIYLYDTLMNKYSEKEILSILAHEGGHWKYDHSLKAIIFGFFTLLINFIIIGKVIKIVYKNQQIPLREMHSPSSLIIIIFLSGLLNFFQTPINSILSRHQEREADLESLVQTKDPASFISSETKMARDNKSRLDNHWLPEFWNATHPSSLERIRMAEKFR